VLEVVFEVADLGFGVVQHSNAEAFFLVEVVDGANELSVGAVGCGVQVGAHETLYLTEFGVFSQLPFDGRGWECIDLSDLLE